MKHRVAIGLGSNINPARNLAAAIAALDDVDEVESVSSTYETAPHGPAGETPFNNAAIVLRTDSDPFSLQRTLRGVEEALGRVRNSDRFGPRTIDLDILLFDDLLIESEGIRIPDPDLNEPHVVIPLAEIAGSWLDPTSGLTVSELAERADSSRVRRLSG